MKSVLIVVHEAGEFVELRRIATGLKQRGYEVSFLFAQPGYINLQQDRGWCRLNGCASFHPGKRIGLSQREEQLGNAAKRLEGGYVPQSLYEAPAASPPFARWVGLILLPFLAVLEMVWSKRKLRQRRKQAKRPPSVRFGAQYRYARKLLNKLSPDLMIFGQEFPGSVNSLLTRLGRDRDIPTFIIPFALGTTKEMCESLSDNLMHDVEFSLMNRVAARLYPRWVNYYGEKALLRLPGQHVLLIEALGLAPDHPWLPNSSHATRILVESVMMERYYRRMKFPETQLRLTGSPSDDALTVSLRSVAKRKDRICKMLGIDPAKPLLVCAWPTDQFGSRFLPLEFPNYEAVCHAWARTLAMIRRTTDYNVIIRPHPVTNREFLGALLKPYRLKMTDIDTLDLVPVSDLFLASVSSTLRWAIACGIPAVNYDCYDYGYTDFDSAKGLFTVKRYFDFEDVMVKLTSDSAAYESARQSQKLSAPEWGMHDGRSMERIFKAIDEAVEQHQLAAQGARGSVAA